MGKIMAVARRTALASGAGAAVFAIACTATGGVAYAAPANHGGAGARTANLRKPSAIHLTGKPAKGVQPYDFQSGDTCYYYPPNFFDDGTATMTGNSDSAQTAGETYPGQNFQLAGTGGTQDSSITGGSDSGEIDQFVGENVQPQNFPSGATVSITTPWSYDGVLKTYGAPA
jgi:hypothetical protein